ncbi:MAG: cytochrome c [Acidobacteria bacterium]|jgi:mono/diheme cytochrome c family protein|nr:cytochrome c [Acidobacteriota bacterium]
MRFIAATGCLALAAGLAGAPASGVGPQERSSTYVVSGSYTYRTYCAGCHGEKGKGDGPLAENLQFLPPDLTQMAKRNGGDYPTSTIRRIVDGREPVEGRGGPDMPVWGDAFKNTETGFDDEQVRLKIASVVDYVRTLQQQ